MGYMRHKYTKSYFLKEDSHGHPTKYGVEGIEDFKKGDIRIPDKKILSRLRFQNSVVLDIGFGRGEAIKYALTHGARKVVGVDFSEDACAIAEDLLKKHGLAAELHCADVLDFIKMKSKETNDKFDFVFLLDVVEHIPRSELQEILSHLPGVLAPKAILCINTPVFDVDNDVIKDGLKSQARDTGDEFEETSGMHCNRYTKESLRTFMKRLGFNSISAHYYFQADYSTNFYINSTPFMWGLAWLKKHPVKLSTLFQKEMYEYATPKKVWTLKELLASVAKRILPPPVVSMIKKRMKS